MIVANLKGGLGNQMFQIAAGYALARRTNQQFCINYKLQHNCIQGFAPSKYKDTLFSKIASTEHVPTKFYSEPHFHYSKIPDYDDVVIDGYFQSIKYFEEYFEEIRNLFTFPKSCYDKHQVIKEATQGSIGMHIRRGDYLKYATTHTPQPIEYYIRAVEALRPKCQPYSVLVASDDWKSVNEEKILDGFGGKVMCTMGCTELEDLYLLSQCKQLIISNSTLAWWAAILGVHNKEVAAPAQWFGPDGPQDYQDIYPEGWHKL